MHIGNKATRDKAVPFESAPVERVDVVGDYSGYSLLATPQSTTNLTKAVRMTRPEKGDIVEAQLFMQMKAPSDKALNVRVGIGTFQSGTAPTIYLPTLTYSDSFIIAQQRLITGQEAAFNMAANGTLLIEANLLPALPRRGDTDFLSDMFVLIVSFDSLPSTLNGYELQKFKLTCSAQHGVNV